MVVGDLKVDSKSHLSKRETREILKRSPKAPRRTPIRRRTKEK